MPRAGWVALTLVAAGFAAPAVAQPLPPATPVGPLAPISPLDAGPPLHSTPVTSAPAPNYDRPRVLGAPVGVAETPARTEAVAPAGFKETERRPQRAAAFGAPSAAGGLGGPPPIVAAPSKPVSSTIVDDAISRTAYQPGTTDPVGDLLARRSELRAEQRDREPPAGESPFAKVSAGKFGEGLTDKFDGMLGSTNGDWFRSDHMFDGFISPVTNPFLFEDPRSLTEVRPIFMYQKIPSNQRDFRGGNVTFFGAQARVALTDRWSLVMHKFGGISVNPGGSSPFRDETGFAEIWLGPKWTFYRGEENGSLAAAGLQFQLPVGSKGAFQDTGTLSLVPYVSYGTNFLRDFRLGSFNFLASTGYSFSVNNERSDYYWLSAHLDFDVGNYHRFYPLVELNWFLNTANGRSTPIGSEGRDLINFGGQARGSGLMTGAFGGRVKLTESAQLGGAFESPFAGRKDLFRYRFTIDFILRY